MSNLTKWRLFVHHFEPCHKKPFLFQEYFQPPPNESDFNPNKNSATLPFAFSRDFQKPEVVLPTFAAGKSLRMKLKLIEISEMDKKRSALFAILDVKNDLSPVAKRIFPKITLGKLNKFLALLKRPGLVRQNEDRF